MEYNNNLPSHVAIIMDGNGRWAKKRMKPRMFGHKAGAKALKRAVEAASELGLEHLSVFAFSTENWNRPEEEVNALMNLFVQYCSIEAGNLAKNNIRIRFIGDLQRLSKKVTNAMKELEEKLFNSNGLSLNICINYSGRNDILNAVKNIVSEEHSIEKIDYELISSKLFTSDIPDPDLLIRTSGEYRISNYFLWQLAYTELVFVDVLWPDFTKDHLKKSVEEYCKRERRFGRI